MSNIYSGSLLLFRLGPWRPLATSGLAAALYSAADVAVGLQTLKPRHTGTFLSASRLTAARWSRWLVAIRHCQLDR